MQRQSTLLSKLRTVRPKFECDGGISKLNSTADSPIGIGWDGYSPFLAQAVRQVPLLFALYAPTT